MRSQLLASASTLLLALSTFATADEKPDVDAGALERVSAHIKYLASDEMEGRGVETKGLPLAADYIRDEFKKIGLKSGIEDGSYFQYFDVPLREKMDTGGSELKLTVGDKAVPLEIGKDFQPIQAGGSGNAEADIVFVGYGVSAPDLEYDDYEGVDVNGKVVLMIRRTPQYGKEDGKFSGEDNRSHSYIDTKLRLAKKSGAAGILLVNDKPSAPDTASDSLANPSQFGRGSARFKIPFVHITRAQADQLIAASPLKAGDKQFASLEEVEAHLDAELKPISQPLANCRAAYKNEFKTKSARAWNVIGVLEGEGPLANETVIVGAHYDHLGFGGYGSRRRGSTEVHNGADDNATGTAAVIELARRFAMAEKKPARRMVFIGFSGEERGLVGSAYYVANPTFPLEETITMLNFDMIGNLRNNTAVIGGTSTGSGLQEVAEAAAGKVSVKMDIKPAASGGSDHLSFIRKRVPILFCNTGLTTLYHTPEDDYETLNMPGTVLVVDYCEALLQGVVGMEERPKFLQSAGRGRRGRPRVYLGVVTTVADDEDAPGMIVTRVVAGSPSAKAGVKVGDLIQTVGDKSPKTPADVATALAKNKPGDKIKVGLIRDGDKVELELELAEPRR